jgi:hypothetical protein
MGSSQWEWLWLWGRRASSLKGLKTSSGSRGRMKTFPRLLDQSQGARRESKQWWAVLDATAVCALTCTCARACVLCVFVCVDAHLFEHLCICALYIYAHIYMHICLCVHRHQCEMCVSMCALCTCVRICVLHVCLYVDLCVRMLERNGGGGFHSDVQNKLLKLTSFLWA